MAGKNEAKYETLKYVDEVVLATGKEIATYRGVTHGCQSTLMRRYWKYGYFNRFSGDGKEKIYSLSENGLKKLEWLESEFEEVDIPSQGRTFKRCRVKREDETENLLGNIKRCKIVRKEGDLIEVVTNPPENN